MNTATTSEIQRPRAARQRAHKAKRAPAFPWSRLQAEAKARFGVERLRAGQREVLEAIFAGRDVLALMPTGAGKSLCYQLPALLLPGLVVVVSPLLALIEDQHLKAEDARIAVEKVDSTLSRAERTEVNRMIVDGVPKLLYVTPERLENREFVAILRETGVSLLAIDEAHCISQWGHDFRPAYMGLGYAREHLGNPPVAALTATATESVVGDILEQLHAKDALVVNTGIERENLAFRVHSTVNREAKLQRVADLVEEEEGTGILYTASVKSAVELFEWLKERGVNVGRYHGRMPTREREAMQARFMAGEYKLLIATKAFGMGIDKPDIRFVYHYEFPDSLESYYQEAGRAGRDGLAARAVLLYRLEDKRIQRFFLLGRHPRMEEIHRVTEAMGEQPAPAAAIAERAGMPRRRTQAILYILKQAGLVRRTAAGYAAPVRDVAAAELEKLVEELKQRGEEDKQRLGEMMRYAESPDCRKQLLRAYFGEEQGERCGVCDNCTETDANAAGRQAELPRGPQAEAVVAVETAVGVVETTAPETLPSREQEGFQPGDGVRHPRFGQGRVVEQDGENLAVRFSAGVKRVRPTYLKAD